jgi:hypothetical protein
MGLGAGLGAIVRLRALFWAPSRLGGSVPSFEHGYGPRKGSEPQNDSVLELPRSRPTYTAQRRSEGGRKTGPPGLQ